MSFDERAATWDDDPEKVARSGDVAAAVRRQLALGDRPRTLELGAGTGLLSRALADDLGPTTLADSSPGMLDVARAVIAAQGLEGWDAVEVDVDAGDLPSGPYDLVLSQLALHHLADPPAVLRLVHDVLSDGGQLAVADLDRDPDGAFHAHHDEFTGHHGFDRGDLAQWLEDAGFTDVLVTTATTIDKEIDGHSRAFDLFLATARRC